MNILVKIQTHKALFSRHGIYRIIKGKKVNKTRNYMLENLMLSVEKEANKVPGWRHTTCVRIKSGFERWKRLSEILRSRTP